MELKTESDWAAPCSTEDMLAEAGLQLGNDRGIAPIYVLMFAAGTVGQQMKG